MVAYAMHVIKYIKWPEPSFERSKLPTQKSALFVMYEEIESYTEMRLKSLSDHPQARVLSTASGCFKKRKD